MAPSIEYKSTVSGSSKVGFTAELNSSIKKEELQKLYSTMGLSQQALLRNLLDVMAIKDPFRTSKNYVLRMGMLKDGKSLSKTNGSDCAGFEVPLGINSKVNVAFFDGKFYVGVDAHPRNQSLDKDVLFTVEKSANGFEIGYGDSTVTLDKKQLGELRAYLVASGNTLLLDDVTKILDTYSFINSNSGSLKNFGSFELHPNGTFSNGASLNSSGQLVIELNKQCGVFGVSEAVIDRGGKVTLCYSIDNITGVIIYNNHFRLEEAYLCNAILNNSNCSYGNMLRHEITKIHGRSKDKYIKRT